MDDDPIFEAVLAGPDAVARRLLVHPSDVNARATEERLVESIAHAIYRGDTPLHLAAATSQSDVARILLEAGADPRAINRRGQTPLHYASDPRARFGESPDPAQGGVIDLLVHSGAELDRGDAGGATPLHRAVRRRNVAAVRALLDLGALPESRLTRLGSSPLHLAATSTGASGTAGRLVDQLEIIDLLRRYGADVDGVDALGRTPRDRATDTRVRAALTP